MLNFKFQCRSHCTIKSKQSRNKKQFKKGVGITIKGKETSGKLVTLHTIVSVHANTIPVG